MNDYFPVIHVRPTVSDLLLLLTGVSGLILSLTSLSDAVVIFIFHTEDKESSRNAPAAKGASGGWSGVSPHLMFLILIIVYITKLNLRIRIVNFPKIYPLPTFCGGATSCCGSTSEVFIHRRLLQLLLVKVSLSLLQPLN